MKLSQRGETIGVVTVKKTRIIVDVQDFDIVELPEKTRGGSTHAAVNLLDEPVILLSKDPEGQWLVDAQITEGEIFAFFMNK